MKRSLFAVIASLFAIAGSFAQDFAKFDALHDQRKLAEELAGLKPLFKASDPQADVAWRLVRAMQEVGVQMPASKKKERLAQFDEALAFAKPLLGTAKGSARDRAKVVYYYGVALGQKGQAMGVLNALFMAGDIRGSCDDALAIDPTYADPYYLKAKVDDAIPEFAGGDKTRMGQLFAKAVELNPTSVYFLADFAMALKGRNKDGKWNKAGDRGVPAGRTDMDYAKEMAKRAFAAFAAIKSPSIDDTEKIGDLKASGL